MAHRFDATLKDLGREAPAAFLAAFDNASVGPLSLLNVDLSAVSKTADLIIGLGDPMHEIVQMDFQASASATKHADVLVYNALLHQHYRVPTHSIVVLLRPQAAHPNLNGSIDYAPRPGRGKMSFSYEVVRLWEQPVDAFLQGALDTVPLAPLAKLPDVGNDEDDMAGVIRQVVDRLLRDAPTLQAEKLLTAAYLLTGLRIPREQARPLFKGAFVMQESDTFLAILDEGAEKEARKLLLRLGSQRYGPATDAVIAKIAAIVDLDRLESLFDRVLTASNWQELLDD